jgi:hypothetical protein
MPIWPRNCHGIQVNYLLTYAFGWSAFCVGLDFVTRSRYNIF